MPKTIEQVREYIEKSFKGAQWVYENATNDRTTQLQGKYAAYKLKMILDYIDSETNQ